MKFPDIECKKTLFVGEGLPAPCLGIGPSQIRGGATLKHLWLLVLLGLPILKQL